MRQNIIAALGVAFLFRAFSYRPPASRGRALLLQALHPMAGRQVDHEHPALFLSRRALLQEDRLHAAAHHPAGGLPVVPDAQDPSAHLHPCALPGPEYRTSEVQVRCPAVPVGYCQHRPLDLDFRPVSVQVVDHVPAPKDANQAPPSLPVWLRARGAQMAQVNHLSPGAQALHPLRVCLSAGRDQMAWAKYLPLVPEVLVVQSALVSLAQTAKAIDLLLAPEALPCRAQVLQLIDLLVWLSSQEVRAQVCLVAPAVSRRRQLDCRQFLVVDSRRQRAVRCPLGARPHEWAVECSSDFLF